MQQFSTSCLYSNSSTKPYSIIGHISFTLLEIVLNAAALLKNGRFYFAKNCKNTNIASYEFYEHFLPIQFQQIGKKVDALQLFRLGDLTTIGNIGWFQSLHLFDTVVGTVQCRKEALSS